MNPIFLPSVVDQVPGTPHSEPQNRLYFIFRWTLQNVRPWSESEGFPGRGAGEWGATGRPLVDGTPHHI